MPLGGNRQAMRERRGWVAPLGIAGLALALLPIAQVPVGPYPPLLAAFFAVLVAAELTTAAVAFAQYRTSLEPLHLGLALTYAASALMTIPHALSFPGVLSAGGLWPETPALTPWLWTAWHVVFPLGLLATALQSERGVHRRAWPIAVVVAVPVVTVGAVTATLVVLRPVLPAIIAGDDYGALQGNAPGLGALAAGILAVAVTAWYRRRIGRLGDWLLLAASASLADTLLTVAAQERYTLGWYAGRVCALTASAAVLVAILRQAVRLAGALAASNRELVAAREDADRQAAEAQAAAHRLTVLLDGMGDAFATLDRDGTIVFLNPHGAALLGDSVAALVGRRMTDVLSEEKAGEFIKGLGPLWHGERSIAFDVVHSRTGRWLSVRGWAAGELISVSVRDVSERREAEERLAYLASHDSLTGLANRARLLERLGQVVARRPEDPPRLAAILFLDLDGFKPINDSLGHDAGDAVLEAIAGRLSAVVRPADTVARLGGDEFVLLCEDLADQGAALRVAERVRHAVERPIAVKDREVVVTASIGIAYARAGEDDPVALLRDADAAMYSAKAARRDRPGRFQAPAGGSAAVTAR